MQHRHYKITITSSAHWASRCVATRQQRTIVEAEAGSNWPIKSARFRQKYISIFARSGQGKERRSAGGKGAVGACDKSNGRVNIPVPRPVVAGTCTSPRACHRVHADIYRRDSSNNTEHPGARFFTEAGCPNRDFELVSGFDWPDRSGGDESTNPGMCQFYRVGHTLVKLFGGYQIHDVFDMSPDYLFSQLFPVFWLW